MNSKRLIICDHDREYAGRLAEYIRRSECGYEVVLYTDPARFADEWDSNGIYRLLIQEGFLDKIMGSESAAGQEIMAVPGCYVLTGNEDSRGEGKIYKYQSASDILSAVGEELRVSHSMITEARRNEGCRMIGVYSPVSHTLKTTLAITLAQISGADKPTLYINTEGYSGLYELFDINTEYSLSDLVYEYSVHPEEIAGFISRYTVRVEDMNILLPARSSAELKEINPYMWISILNAIASTSLFSTIVMDISDEIQGVPEILNVCGQIYMPVRKDPVAMAKLRAFDEVLAGYPGGNEIRNRMIRLKFPYFDDIETTFGNLRHGKLARYIKQEIAGDI